MEIAAILITSFTVLFFSFYLFKEVAGTMAITRLNMLSFLFYVPLVLMSFIGSIFIVLQIDNHYLINKIHFEETRYFGWLAILYTMIMLPIGMLLAKKLILQSKVSSSLKSFNTKNISFSLGKKELILKSLLISLTFFGVGILAYTFLQIGSIPLIALLKGNASELSRLRIMASREFGGNVYLRNIFAIQLLPLLAFVSFAYFQKEKSFLNLFWFLLALLASIMALTYDLQKSPLALFLTGFIFFFVWVNGRINFGKLFGFSAIFLGIILFFYIGFGNSDIQQILLQYNEGASGRVLFSQIAGTFFSFEVFDHIKPFIGFESISRVVENFGMTYSERAGRLIMEIINPRGIKEGTAGVQNTLFIGEAWANFGILGLLLSPIYVGFVIGTLFYLLLRLPKTPLFIGVYAFFSYKIALVGGFNDYYYNIAYLSIFLIMLLLLLYAERIALFISPSKSL